MSIVGAFIMPHPPVLVPDIGKGSEKDLCSTAEACHRVAKEIADLKPDTVILVTPHLVMYEDYFHISPEDGAKGDFAAFGAEAVKFDVKYDVKLRDSICRAAKENRIAAGMLGEQDAALDYGTMVPLWFINQEYASFRLIRIGLSGMPMKDHYRLGQSIGEACKKTKKRTVIIASGDLAHRLKESGPYGYAEEGPAFDRHITEAIRTGNFMQFLEFEPWFCDKAAECGLGSFTIMAGSLDGYGVESELLSYEGPYGVGYGVGRFIPSGEDAQRLFGELFYKKMKAERKERRQREDEYVKLARRSLETYVKIGRMLPVPEGLSSELYDRRAGVFVSIKKDGLLRGCIGTIAPAMDCMADEIIRNAISAGTKDPRYEPVEKEELEELIYSVDILGEPEPVESEKELDVTQYGVIVTCGNKRGLLLPNLEGVNSVELQISMARKKGGIREQDAIKLDRFEVVRHL